PPRLPRHAPRGTRARTARLRPAGDRDRGDRLLPVVPGRDRGGGGDQVRLPLHRAGALGEAAAPLRTGTCGQGRRRDARSARAAGPGTARALAVRKLAPLLAARGLGAPTASAG